MTFIPVVYLTSYLLSLLGNAVAAIALPLIVLQTTESALGAGTVAAATAIPAVLAGLLMGVVIDRVNRRTSSVVTDIVSAASIAALPIVDLLSGLTIGWFVLFGVIGSLGDVPGMTAREALLPAIVRHGGISAERLMGIRESLGAVAILLGPAAAGALMVIFDGTTVLWITAATSLGAALLTLLIPHRVGAVDGAATGAASGAATGTASADRTSAWAHLREGWTVLLRSRFLLTVTALSVVSVTVLAALQGLVLPVYFTSIEQPGLLGFVLSALALGMLGGGAVYAVVGRRLPRRWWFVSGTVGTILGFVLLGLLASVGMIFVGAFVVGFASGLFGALLGVLMIERIPDAMRGRIMGTQNAIMTGAPAVGLIVAALLIEYADVRVAALTLAAVWTVVAVAALFARSLRTLEPTSVPAFDRPAPDLPTRPALHPTSAKGTLDEQR